MDRSDLSASDLKSDVGTQARPKHGSHEASKVHSDSPGEGGSRQQSSYRTDMQERLRLAREAQALWAGRRFEERAEAIHRMRAYLVAHGDELAACVSQATGKTRVDALTTEVLPCSLACQWYAKNAKQVLAPKRLSAASFLFLNKRSLLHREPLGVVGIISPWNYPLAIPFGEVIMGLMAGNAILLKVSPDTPSIGPLIEKIVESGQLPPGLFQRLDGPGEELADALFFAGVDKIFFTGSVRVGKILMRQAAETLTPLSLELGGKDPMLVLEDADLERAANGALWGAFQNAGQTCAGIERLYVHEQVYEPFVDLLARKVAGLRHGRDHDFNVDMGAMTTERQWQAVHAQVEEACRRGAKVLAQSRLQGANDPLLYPATLLTGVDHSMTVMHEETFGPVLGVMKFRHDEDAVRLANDSPYALTASIWTKSHDRAKRLAARISAGVVTINDHLYTHAVAGLPWGGPKNSGLGRTHGALGLIGMTEPKVINWDILPLKKNIYWYPHSGETYRTLQAALRLTMARSWRAIWDDAPQLARYYLAKLRKPGH